MNNTYLCKISHEFEDAVDEILDYKKAQVQQLKNALEQNNYDEIRKIAHAMKGIHGIEQIYHLAQLVGDAAKQKERDTIQQLITQLEDFLTNIQIQYVDADG